MNQELRITADGSHTIYNSRIDECYHSLYGARSESEHIFVRNGFCEVRKTEITVFEVGFGTGLNAFLTLEASLKQNKKVRYMAVEIYPLLSEVYTNLNFAVTSAEQERFLRLHTADWEQYEAIEPCFSLKKTAIDFTKLSLNDTFDVVYFDAFSPEKQPEMWSEALFEKLYNAMNDGGVLVTYCAKGVVRRTMQSVGFSVERIAGPMGGKREILRARK